MTSPCLTCDTLADCGTCLPRLAYEGATLPPEPAPCPTCSETEWLLLSGEQIEQVAARLGMHPKSLRSHLRRRGHRGDLIWGAA